MKENTVNEAIEMVDKFLSLVTVDLDDELDKQLVAAYIFGMLNGKAHEESIPPTDVQALMIRIGIDKLNYPTEVSYQMTQFMIDATDREFHPTVNAIIHRGIEAYYLFVEKNYDKLAADFKYIIETIKQE